MLKTSILGRLSQFGRDRRGVSAVEFAVLAPVMVALYLGCVEISDGVGADRKVSLTAGALANLTAQATTISTTQMTDILDASSAVIVPYDAANLRMTVTCLSIDANRNARVKWSVTRNGTVEAGTLTIPAALNIANTQLIYSEVTYAYTPVVGYTISGTLTLSDHMYMSPRITPPNYNGTACT
ncbi:MAG TPA: TadE/TadG family type IV pilus assembly protein [Pseudolabrys sp.]|jgi:Flp pilus assembly protein TadG